MRSQRNISGVFFHLCRVIQKTVKSKENLCLLQKYDLSLASTSFRNISSSGTHSPLRVTLDMQAKIHEFLHVICFYCCSILINLQQNSLMSNLIEMHQTVFKFFHAEQQMNRNGKLMGVLFSFSLQTLQKIQVSFRVVISLSEIWLR